MSIFKFIRLRPPTIVDLVMIAIGLASLYFTYLQVAVGGGGMSPIGGAQTRIRYAPCDAKSASQQERTQRECFL